MEERKLLLLGLLLSQSQHGYQINDFIEKNLSGFVDMKRSTAYSTLDNLCESGHVQMQMEQVGNRPARKVYTLTDDGRGLFDELLREYLVKLEGFEMPVETALLYIDSMEEPERREWLAKRVGALDVSIATLSATPAHGFGVGVDLAIHHRLHMMQAEREWLLRLL